MLRPVPIPQRTRRTCQRWASKKARRRSRPDDRAGSAPARASAAAVKGAQSYAHSSSLTLLKVFSSAAPRPRSRTRSAAASQRVSSASAVSVLTQVSWASRSRRRSSASASGSPAQAVSRLPASARLSMSGGSARASRGLRGRRTARTDPAGRLPSQVERLAAGGPAGQPQPRGPVRVSDDLRRGPQSLGRDVDGIGVQPQPGELLFRTSARATRDLVSAALVSGGSSGSGTSGVAATKPSFPSGRGPAVRPRPLTGTSASPERPPRSARGR